jgi:hypothetical protein
MYLFEPLYKYTVMRYQNKNYCSCRRRATRTARRRLCNRNAAVFSMPAPLEEMHIWAFTSTNVKTKNMLPIFRFCFIPIYITCNTIKHRKYFEGILYNWFHFLLIKTSGFNVLLTLIILCSRTITDSLKKPVTCLPKEPNITRILSR